MASGSSVTSRLWRCFISQLYFPTSVKMQFSKLKNSRKVGAYTISYSRDMSQQGVDKKGGWRSKKAAGLVWWLPWLLSKYLCYLIPYRTNTTPTLTSETAKTKSFKFSIKRRQFRCCCYYICQIVIVHNLCKSCTLKSSLYCPNCIIFRQILSCFVNFFNGVDIT